MTRRIGYALLGVVGCTSTNTLQDAGLDSAVDVAALDGAVVDVADAAASPQTPLDIFGYRLVEWYDASDTQSVDQDGGIVAVWRDRSLWRSRNMSARYGAMGLRLEPNAANGRPAMHVGAQYGCFRVGSPPMGGDILLVMIASFTNGANQVGTLWSTKAMAPYGGAFVTVNVVGTRAYAGLAPWPNGAQSTLVGLNDGQLHAFALRGNGKVGSVRIRVDGIEDAADSGLGAPNDLETWIGGEQPLDAGIQNAVEGYVAEIMAVGGLGTDSEMAQLAKYIKDKYAIVL